MLRRLPTWDQAAPQAGEQCGSWRVEAIDVPACEEELPGVPALGGKPGGLCRADTWDKPAPGGTPAGLWRLDSVDEHTPEAQPLGVDRANTWDKPAPDSQPVGVWRVDTWDRAAPDGQPGVWRVETWDKPAPAVNGATGAWQADTGHPAATTTHGGFPSTFRSVLRQVVGDSIGETPVKGRGLIRTYTHDDKALGSMSVRDVAPRLERLHSGGLVDLGEVKVGRVPLQRLRSSSTDRRESVASIRASRFHAPVVHQYHGERPSSVPPPLPSSKVTAAAEATDPESSAAPPKLPLQRTICREFSKEVRDMLAAPQSRNMERDVRRQLRIVVAGLMGSGKSTLCRMLADLLEGVWVNQDEFSHLQRGAKRGFLDEIRRDASDRRVPVLIVDKINTMVQHRSEILEAMSSGVPGDVVFVQVAHPSDRPGSLHHQLDLCLSRIRARGDCHRTLLGTDPKLESILRMSAGGAQDMGADELSMFTAHFIVDMTAPPTFSVMQLLADLDNHSLLGRFHVEELVTQERLETALQATMQTETRLAQVPDAGKRCAGNDRAKPAPIWMWQAVVGPQDAARILGEWREVASSEGLDAQLCPPRAFHTTLLYVGGRSDAELASRHPHMTSQAFHQLRESLGASEGKDLEMELTAFVWDDQIACAEVANIRGWTANQHPHITIAMAPRVPPVVSNELLCRRAANLDFEAGLGPWLQQLGLASYTVQATEICRQKGITSADAMAERAADIAAALEADEDQRHRLSQVLSRAAPGRVQERLISPPLSLRASLRGKQRGERGAAFSAP